jgi:hypothetical protein
MTSKVLKVLKVLNFSGAGEGNTFRCTFTGAAVNPHTLAPNDPHPCATQGRDVRVSLHEARRWANWRGGWPRSRQRKTAMVWLSTLRSVRLVRCQGSRAQRRLRR